VLPAGVIGIGGCFLLPLGGKSGGAAPVPSSYCGTESNARKDLVDVRHQLVCRPIPEIPCPASELELTATARRHLLLAWHPSFKVLPRVKFSPPGHRRSSEAVPRAARGDNAEGGFNSRNDEVHVDEVDLRIYRWMYPGGVWSWWGADPRITTTEIGSRVGLERTAVWARIRRWRRDGFWDGFGVLANPRIFDVGQVRVEIPVLGAAQGAEVLDRLEHVDGVLRAMVVFGHSLHGREGETVVVVLAAEDATRVNQRLRLLRRLSSTGDLEGPFRDAIPPCTYSLTPLDWRILAALIANPNASPARLARLVGVTLKTFTHHHSILIERHAIFWLPRVDWSRLECVFLEMFCRRPEDVERARAELQARYPAAIPIDLKGGEGISPGWNHSTCFAAWVPARSPNRVHTLVCDVSKIPGVRLVLSETSGQQRLYLDWVNRRVAEHIAVTSAAVPGRTPRLGVPKRIALATTMPTEGHEMTAH